MKLISSAVILYFLVALSFNRIQAQILPYQNANFKVEERVKDLIKRMTIEEKVNRMRRVILQKNHWMNYSMVRVLDVWILRLLMWMVLPDFQQQQISI